jgi:PmbA protein
MELVSDGVLNTWLAESASARQLGIRPTGHAVRGVAGAPGAGPSNLYLAPGNRSRDEIIASLQYAILVTELNRPGGQWSHRRLFARRRGFLISNGEIGPAVAEITIASNLKQMFATLEPASDLRIRRGIDSPTLLVPEMTVASA